MKHPSLVGAALGTLAIFLGIASSAMSASATPNPSLSPSSSAPVQVAAQDADGTAVAAFLSQHTAPTTPSSAATAAEQNTHWAAEVAYWQTVPWTDIAGQWGCQVKSVSVTRDLKEDANGVLGAGYSLLLDCGPNPSPALVNAATTIAARPDLQSTTSSAASAPASTDAYQNQGCGEGSETEDCLYSDFSAGMNKATAEWLVNSVVVGQVRLAQIAPSTCGNGVAVATSPEGEGQQYAVWTVTHTVSVDTGWVSEFLESGAVISRFCATF